MSVREVIDRITGYRASLWEDVPSEEDLRRELAESSAAVAFGKQGVAPLPESVRRLSEVLSDPGFRTQDAVDAIESDPALAIDILRLANSAAFRGASGCSTTMDAFTRLGASRIKDFVLVSYLERRGDSMSGFSRIAFDHSVRVAQIARALPASETCMPERMYLCGLVHDIGITLLDESNAFTYYIGHYVDDEAQCRAERHALGFDHATLGAVVVELWGLPTPFPEVLVAHHSSARALSLSPQVAWLSACLMVAEDLEQRASEVGGLPAHAFDEVVASDAGRFLALSSDVLSDVWNERVVGLLNGTRNSRSAA